MLRDLSPLEQVLAQVMGYCELEDESLGEYVPMTKDEMERNSVVLKNLAHKIYLKYVGREIPESIKFSFIRRTAKNIKSTGICICERENRYSPMTVKEIKIEEEIFFYPKDMVSVLKHELAHLYEVEETGRTRHGKFFRTLMNVKFKLPWNYILQNPKSIENRLYYLNNKKILRSFEIKRKQFEMGEN